MRVRGRSLRWTTLLAGTCWAAVAGGLCPAQPRVRCAYFYGHDGPEHFCALEGAGLNLGIAKLSLNPADPFADALPLRMVAGLARGAGATRVRFMPVLNWAGNHEVQFVAGTRRRFVTDGGKRLDRTPCPNDPRHWKHAFEARCIAIGDLLAGPSPAGVILDPEMYGADTWVYPACGCYCDHCWAEFLAHTGAGAPLGLAAGQRAQWVRDHGKDALYVAHQEQVLAALVRAARQAIHAEHPALELGFLHYADTAFFRGLARGMGTDEKPVLIFPESTYGSGYDKGRVDDVITSLGNIGAHARLIPGLWISKWHPDDLKAQVYECARHSAGYWVFTTHSLAVPAGKLKGDYRIPHPAEAYWEALRKANAELDELATDPSYESRLRIGPRKPVFLPPEIDGTELPALLPVNEDGLAGFSNRPASRLRGRAVVYLYRASSRPARLRLACQRVGNYGDGLSWVVFGPARQVVARGAIPLGEQRELDLDLPEGVTCALVGNAGANTFSVDAQACHASCPTGPWLHLCKQVAPALYFLVPKTTRAFSVHLKTDNEFETVSCSVISPLGRLAAGATGSFPMAHELAVNASPPERGGIWRLVLAQAPTGILEDVRIAFSDEIPPYVAETPGRLLAPEAHGRAQE